MAPAVARAGVVRDRADQRIGDRVADRRDRQERAGNGARQPAHGGQIVEDEHADAEVDRAVDDVAGGEQ